MLQGVGLYSPVPTAAIVGPGSPIHTGRGRGHQLRLAVRELSCPLCLTCTWGRRENRAEAQQSDLNLKPGWSPAGEKRSWEPESWAGPDKGGGLYPPDDAWEI